MWAGRAILLAPSAGLGVRVAVAKAPVECLVARGCGEPFAYVRTIEIERRGGSEYPQPP